MKKQECPSDRSQPNSHLGVSASNNKWTNSNWTVIKGNSVQQR